MNILRLTAGMNLGHMLKHLTVDNTRSKKLVLLALVLSIAPFLILSFFCHPAYDDFCFSVSTMETGFIDWQRAMYKDTTGRYFLSAIFHFNPLTVGSLAGYKAIALLIILLLFVSIFCFLDALLKSSFGLLDKLIGASFLMGLFTNQMPDVTEAYYLMTAKIAYQLPNVLTLFFFTLVIRSSEKSKRVKLLLTLLSCVLIVAIVGSSEISMVILGLLVFTITITMWIAKSEQRRTWLVFLVITMICAAIVIAAPGNAVRSSNFPIRHRLFFSLKESLLQEARFLIIWLSNPVFILGTIFFVPIADRLSDKISALKSLAFHPLVSSLVLLTIVFLGCFPVYWATGSMGQLRTMNVAYFFFLIGWFINIVIWVDYLKRKRGFATAKLPHYVYVIGVPLLFCTLLFSNNMKTAIADLVSGRAYHYDKAVKERYAQFRQCVLDGHLDDCPVVTISDLPATITNPYYETEFDCQKLYWKLEVQSSGRR